ncbi:MAG: hypothetical protein K6T39_09790, partial [Anoxybacillus ayderensis]|nr:hypothetical protein [Anoxybacillus ayderensis]
MFNQFRVDIHFTHIIHNNGNFFVFVTYSPQLTRTELDGIEHKAFPITDSGIGPEVNDGQGIDGELHRV